MTLPLVCEYRVDEVHVQVADVTPLLSPEAIDACLPMVSAQRRENALAFKHLQGRALSLGAGLLLDAMLRPQGLREHDLTYAIGEHGKPAIAGHENLHFNLSHTSHFVACAVGAHPVGIDIQSPKQRVSEALMRKTLSDREREWVTESTDASNFFRLWVLKEAWFKCVGSGITSTFPEFSLEGATPVVLRDDAASFRFHEFSFDDCRGALCINLKNN